MVHGPAATNVTVVPFAVQTDIVSDEKVTANPEDPVALTVNGAAPKVLLASAPKVIVWVVGAIAETAPLPTRSADTISRAKMTADRATHLARPAKIPPLGHCASYRCGQLCPENPVAGSA